MAGPFALAVLRSLTRRYPFLSGCTFPNHPAFVALTGRPPASHWVRVEGGEVLARLDDFVGRCAYFVGDLDRKISALFARVVGSGDVVLDVGANIGLTALRLSSIVGDKGVVHAVEANPALASQLDHTVARNGLTNIRIHAFGLGKEWGPMTLTVPVGNMGAASAVAGRVRGPAKQIAGEMKTLDGAFGELTRLRLIKIDVEGFEHNVIAGGRKTIERLRPIVLFEANAGAEREEILRYFRRIDYRLFGLKKSLFRLVLSEITGDDDSRHHDLVAFPVETDVSLPAGAVLREPEKKAA